jgi:hypothetical protein
VFAPAAAREEHEELLRGHDVLTAQQARAIGRELRLSAPLQEGESHGQQCKAREGRQRTQTDERQDGGNGPVERVPADDVTHLVGEQHAQLVVAKQLDGRGVHHDERMVDAVGAGVHHRRLRHVQLGDFGPVEGRAHLGVEVPQARKLMGSHADGIAEEEEPDATLAAEHGEDAADDVVHAGHGAKCLQGGAVGGMLPRDGGDVGERAPGTGSRDGRRHGYL